MTSTPVAPTHRFGYAAFARDDVPDAKRRGPGVDLSGYAAARGLQFLGSALPAGFVAVTPPFGEYLVNLMRGPLPRGWYGLLAHQLYEVPLGSDGPSMSGTFFGQRSVTRSTAKWWDWFELFAPDRPHEPFAADAIWVPTSLAACRVPEAALLPRTLIRRSENLSRFGNRDLASCGVPGFRMQGGPADETFLARLLGGPFGAQLRRLASPFVEVVVDAGTVGLTRNGYATDPAALDELAGQVVVLAEGLRQACAPDADPQPFAVPLPPSAAGAGGHAALYASAAASLGLTPEDPHAFHRAFPSQPVPGVAQGVLRGVLPGTPTTLRLAWFADGQRPRDGWLRGAVLLPARAGAPAVSTPAQVPEVDLFVEVRDGIAAAWRQRRLRNELAAGDLLDVGVATLRQRGVVDG